MSAKEDKSSGPQRHEGLRQALQAFSFLGGIGIYFCVVVGICVFAGNWADDHWGLGYYGKLTGILIGFPIGIYSVYKKIRSIS